MNYNFIYDEQTGEHIDIFTDINQISNNKFVIISKNIGDGFKINIDNYHYTILSDKDNLIYSLNNTISDLSGTQFTLNANLNEKKTEIKNLWNRLQY